VVGFCTAENSRGAYLTNKRTWLVFLWDLNSMRNGEIRRLSGKAGGSTLTLKARNDSLKHISKTLNDDNLQVANLGELKIKHVERYIEIQRENGVSNRTLQNRMTHLRTVLNELGRHQMAAHERLSSKGLGIAGASRDGTHRALSPDAAAKVFEAAKSLNAGFAACLVMQRELGLRAREAVQSVASLQSWRQALERGHAIRVLHGTKGGKARDTMPVDRGRALEAVKTALNAISASDGRLMRGQSLESAMQAFHRDCAKVGLTGVNASHCLRYGYAQERFAQLLERLGDRKEALAATSMELGHGDGRGTYIAQVYLK
jgi:site-specific recombinase XerC